MNSTYASLSDFEKATALIRCIDADIHTPRGARIYRKAHAAWMGREALIISLSTILLGHTGGVSLCDMAGSCGLAPDLCRYCFTEAAPAGQLVCDDCRPAYEADKAGWEQAQLEPDLDSRIAELYAEAEDYERAGMDDRAAACREQIYQLQACAAEEHWSDDQYESTHPCEW